MAAVRSIRPRSTQMTEPSRAHSPPVTQAAVCTRRIGRQQKAAHGRQGPLSCARGNGEKQSCTLGPRALKLSASRLKRRAWRGPAQARRARGSRHRQPRSGSPCRRRRRTSLRRAASRAHPPLYSSSDIPSLMRQRLVGRLRRDYAERGAGQPARAPLGVKQRVRRRPSQRLHRNKGAGRPPRTRPSPAHESRRPHRRWAAPVTAAQSPNRQRDRRLLLRAAKSGTIQTACVSHFGCHLTATPSSTP
jgi:hypothetical protein